MMDVSSSEISFNKYSLFLFNNRTQTPTKYNKIIFSFHLKSFIQLDQKVQLVREQMDDFQSVQSTGFQSLNSETSVSSDDDAYNNIANLASIAAQENENVPNVMFAATTMETSMNEVRDNVKLAQLITTARELLVTLLDRLYINP
jgi:hypothetical protein